MLENYRWKLNQLVGSMGVISLQNLFFQQIGSAVFRKSVREVLFVSKTVQNFGMIQKLYDYICIQKYQKHIAWLYTARQDGRL